MYSVQMTLELARILKLPRRQLDLTKVPDLSRHFLTDADCSGCRLCRKGPVGLRPAQSASLIEAKACKGLFAGLSVGEGKTLTALLLPKQMGVAKAVLLIKPSLKSQLIETDIPLYGRHFQLPTIHTVAKGMRFDLDGLYVVAYSELSSVTHAEILEKIQPQLVIADEAHLISRNTAARTKRFFRFMHEHPEVMFAALSGTMASKSLRSYAYLIGLALRDGSPLPRKWSDVEEWCAAIDPVDKPLHPGKLLMLCHPGESVRSGFQRRLTETAGVVTTPNSEIGCSLEIVYRRIPVPKAVQDALKHLRQYWQWDGNDLEDFMAMNRVAKQLGCGFFYRWAWPNGVVDKEWLEARNAWHREIRHFLSYSATVGMDSPLLLTNAAMSGKWKSNTWAAWAKVKHRPPPPVVEVVIDEFLFNDVVKRANELSKEGKVIVWVEHTYAGKRISELGQFPYFGADSAVELTRCDPERNPIIICSISAHKEGRNLQAFSRGIVVSPPANDATWEQIIGRKHRTGQLADEVIEEVCTHTKEFEDAMVSALKDAYFVEKTTGLRRKLTIATKIGENKHV